MFLSESTCSQFKNNVINVVPDSKGGAECLLFSSDSTVCAIKFQSSDLTVLFFLFLYIEICSQVSIKEAHRGRNQQKETEQSPRHRECERQRKLFRMM